MSTRKLPVIALFSAVIALTGAASARAASLADGTPASAEAAGPTTSAATKEARASQRPRAFFNFMLTGAMVHEDRDDRLTTLRHPSFATPGIALRAGGVVRRNHLVGGLFQANWRSTRAVWDSAGDDRKWGAISSYYVGPEYRYLTAFGLYAGASLGFAYTFADNDVGGGGAPGCNRYACLVEHMKRSDDQGIPGVGLRAVLGFEHRLRRNLAVNAEAFAGVLHGGDEDGVAMTTPTYGLAVGVGF